jgi:hypothetical protein
MPPLSYSFHSAILRLKRGNDKEKAKDFGFQGKFLVHLSAIQEFNLYSDRCKKAQIRFTYVLMQCGRMCLKRENNWAKTTQQEPLEEFLSNQ